MKRLVLLALLACAKPGSATDASVPADAATSPSGTSAIALRAADLRRAKDVPAELRTSHVVAHRRASAQALARIADEAARPGLLAHLGDVDAETVGWAAYGLGFTCKGHEEATVKALAARAANLPDDPSDAVRPRSEVSRATIESRRAIARAMGRCGSASAGERVLLDLFRSGLAWEASALEGLGDLASLRKQLEPDTMNALLEAASRPTAAADGAFYALSRVEAGEAFGKRVLGIAKAALARPGPSRILAIKTLPRVAKFLPREAAAELGRIVAEPCFDAAERAEAAHSLGALGEAGKDAAADALGRITPDRNDAIAVQALMGSSFNVLYTLVVANGAEPLKKAEPSLRALAGLVSPAKPSAALASRLARLRCAAALGLARGIYEADVLKKCDVETSEVSQHARLQSLLRRPVTESRRNAFRVFTKSEHLLVREAALDAIGEHPELGDVAVTVLAEALSSTHAGLVATAAEAIHAHPERVVILAESEKRAALDPKAPPPGVKPAQELSREVKSALAVAMARPFARDSFETRMALIDAAAAVNHPDAKAFATKACADPNPAVREHASRALRSLGEKVEACEATAHEGTVAKELDGLRTEPTRIALTTGTGELVIVLEPDLAPVTVTRIAALVTSGFYDGIVFHRVVPGFVAQFGDPEGDGYGGSGEPLRCETSPVAFGSLDVGMALAGRDTGSSQLFVTLSRTPHLDGVYTRVGRAEGEWDRIAEGDVITKATLR